MFSDVIRQAVLATAQDMIQNHPSIAAARRGDISAEGVARYLSSIHFLLTNTVPHLTLARRRADDLGLANLSGFFARKLEEETGHERWAEEDIARFRQDNPGLIAASPVPAVRELVRLLEQTIGDDPRLYVVYIVANEYFTVLAGPAWIEALSDGCGVSPQALTAVGKHVAADRAHAAAGFSQIDDFLHDASLAEPVAQLLGKVFDHFWAMVEQATLTGIAPAA